MSRTPTTKLLLSKPDPGSGEPVIPGTDLGTNWDKVDDAVGATIVTSSTRPTGTDAWVGRFIRESDTGYLYLCVTSGSPGPAVWRQILVDNSTGFVANDQLIVVQRTGAAAAQRYMRIGDANPRLEVNSDGVLLWGSGSATGDTNLFRDSANTLRTNDSLTVDGNLSVAGVGRTITARKTADTSRSSANTGATLTDDPHLVADSLPANSVWIVDMSIAWNAHTTPDFKCDFSVPAGASFSRWRAVTNGTASVWTSHQVLNSTVLFQAGSGTDAVLLISGLLIVGGTAGNFRFRWAQNTSDANNTTVYSTSWLRLIRHS